MIMAATNGVEMVDLKRTYRKPLISRPIAPRQIKACLETPGFIENEFKQLPDIVVKDNEYPSEIDFKNRYCNILPTASTRVKLTNSSSKTDGYVNANLIRGHGDIKDAYIATQGPLSHTVNDFWRMLWDYGSDVIIMGSDWSEGGIERSARYIPQNEGATVEYSCYRVTLTECISFRDYVFSILTVKNVKTQNTRQLRHYRITSWPLKTLPSKTETITTLLRTIKSWESSSGPVIVHCSSGAGRTGVIIAIDIGLQSLLHRELKIDVLRIASSLKQDRLVLIQTAQQYRFINQALADMVKDLGL